MKTVVSIFSIVLCLVFCSLSYGWDNSMGAFSQSSCLNNWGFEPVGSGINLASYSWLSAYAGKTGLLKISYTTQTEGVKMTSISRFSASTSSWYKISVTYCFDSPCSNSSVMPLGLLYDTNSTYNMVQLSGGFTGMGLIKSGQWYTFTNIFQAYSPTGQIQLQLQNNNSSGAMYIDSISFDTYTLPLSLSTVTGTGGSFTNPQDTTLWGFEPTDGLTMPSFSWYSSSNPSICVSFTTSNQAIKMTSQLFNISSINSTAVYSFKVKPTVNTSAMEYVGYLYAESSSAMEMSGTVFFGDFPPNNWATMTIPFISPSGLKNYRMQTCLECFEPAAGPVYFDEATLQYQQ